MMSKSIIATLIALLATSLEVAAEQELASQLVEVWKRTSLVQIGCCCLAMAICGICDMSRAQSGQRGDGHAEHHDMYRDWQRPDVGGGCCNGESPEDPSGDCRPVKAYLADDGWWRARIGPGPYGWVVVPSNRILKGAADGRCHVCERFGAVICFQPCGPES